MLTCVQWKNSNKQPEKLEVKWSSCAVECLLVKFWKGLETRMNRVRLTPSSSLDGWDRVGRGELNTT